MPESNKRLKTKAQIEQALVSLLQHQNFDQISTSELARAAGVSRSSFYTHYKDKYDVIDHYQEKLSYQLEQTFKEFAPNQRKMIIHIFHLLRNEPLFAALLSENGTHEIHFFLRHKLHHILAQDLQQRQKSLSDTERDYRTVFLTHAFFGACQTWTSRNFKETPEEVADFLIKLLN